MLSNLKPRLGLAIAGALGLLTPGAAWGQTATDLICVQCVDTRDIADKTIKKRDLAAGAVGTAKILDGAVTGDKIAVDAVSGAAIQDGSVSAADLAVGAVGASNLAANAVTSGAIQDGSVSGADLAVGAVGASNLAANAVTNAAILNGSISSSKLAGGAVLNPHLAAGAVATPNIQDGAVTAMKLSRDAVFGRIFVVRADPLDAVGNCDELRAVLAGITDNDASNRYLVFLEPGVYDCGATAVQMKPFVTVAGSGQGATEITGTVDGSGGGFPGVLQMASDVELRHLTVTNTGGGTDSFAIGGTGTNLRLADVTAEALDGVFSTAGISLSDCDGTFINVTATGTSVGGSREGMQLQCTSAMVTNLTAEGLDTGFTQAGNGSATLRNSVITGGSVSVFLFLGTLNVAYSQLIGTVSGSPNCVGNYDATLNPVAC